MDLLSIGFVALVIVWIIGVHTFVVMMEWDLQDLFDNPFRFFLAAIWPITWVSAAIINRFIRLVYFLSKKRKASKGA